VKKRCYFALVIDEYGGLSGIVTLHDLMEALVGDLYDAEDQREETIRYLGENRWEVYGCADVSEVSQALGVSLPEKLYDTFGGFLCGILDEIPEDGAELFVETECLRIQILSVENHRIGVTTVEKKNEIPEKSPGQN